MGFFSGLAGFFAPTQAGTNAPNKTVSNKIPAAEAKRRRDEVASGEAGDYYLNKDEERAIKQGLWIPVQSSCVLKLRWTSLTAPTLGQMFGFGNPLGQCDVVFKGDGKVYQLERPMSLQEFKGWLTAESKGQHWHYVIQPSYGKGTMSRG